MIFVSLNLVPESYGTSAYGSTYGYFGAASSTMSYTTTAPTPPPSQALDPILINIALLSGINTLNCTPGTCYVQAGSHSWHVQHTKEQVIEKVNAAIAAATVPPAA